MASLETTYMGIKLNNPVIAGASSLTSHMESIKKIEEAGAGALVIASLFEEQIQLERFKLDEDLEKFNYRHPEMINIFPCLEHAGPKEHLMWVKKAREAVKIPVIASLNAVNRETWVEYAYLLEKTGVDGLELNFFSTPSEFEREGSEIEKEQIGILREIKKNVSLPVSVKLSIHYTNPLNFIKRLDNEEVNGFVLFNRFFQPDINVEAEKHTFPFNFSSESDNRLPLRFTGLLYGNIKGDICTSTGIMNAGDVIKMILAGASCVQIVSTLFKNGISHIKIILQAMEEWMNGKKYENLESFRGKMSRKNVSDPWVYTRAQYVRLLMNPEELLKNLPVK